MVALGEPFTCASRLAMPLQRMQHNPMDLRHLERPIHDSTLRSVGEKAAAVFPGLRDMGVAPVTRVPLKASHPVRSQWWFWLFTAVALRMRAQQSSRGG